MTAVVWILHRLVDVAGVAAILAVALLLIMGWLSARLTGRPVLDVER